MNSTCPACGPELLAFLQAEPGRFQRWQALPRRQLKRGDCLLRAGEVAPALWFVEVGLLRGQFLDADGRERIHAFYPELQWLGLPGAEQASPYTLEAMERSQLVVFTHAELQGWQALWPGIGELLWQALAVQVRRLTERQQQWLMLDAGARYQSFLRDEPSLARRLKLKDVASYLGLTNVALSRIRRRLGSAQMGD
ncbi:Crp/Fnr family transcriptional regulator [Roseateles oligotrophus]|uniref:Crp/Fnr family transcriptional regulator n=1 Tax=Roseateles oligotrophus TaxID=1769250 RepID=A0ABT2YD55_9BURK|nr:Crp/Fnr family transcriptional regulator [Roseateles oligotrophus]MCV2367986.1 Crp/Fnr family transcriptional regulator [Roseateles oligotrophus]